MDTPFRPHPHADYVAGTPGSNYGGYDHGSRGSSRRSSRAGSVAGYPQAAQAAHYAPAPAPAPVPMMAPPPRQEVGGVRSDPRAGRHTGTIHAANMGYTWIEPHGTAGQARPRSAAPYHSGTITAGIMGSTVVHPHADPSYRSSSKPREYHSVRTAPIHSTGMGSTTAGYMASPATPSRGSAAATQGAGAGAGAAASPSAGGTPSRRDTQRHTGMIKSSAQGYTTVVPRVVVRPSTAPAEHRTPSRHTHTIHSRRHGYTDASPLPEGVTVPRYVKTDATGQAVGNSLGYAGTLRFNRPGYTRLVPYGGSRVSVPPEVYHSHTIHGTSHGYTDAD